MAEPDETTSAEVARFYDAVRSRGPSLTAVAHQGGYIGQECTLTANEIADFAERAGLSARMSVLDVGSGKGGPACFLAQRFGCRILGVDVSGVGHAEAEARARAAGLSEQVAFRLDDIHAVALPPAGFDAVIGLDSWCHIPRRPLLLERCAALLKPGGRLAFWDHVERRPHPEAARRRFHAMWRFAGLETPESYRQWVAAAGLQVTWHEVTSAYVERFYTRLIEAYLGERQHLEALDGAERYRAGLERLQLSRELAVTDVLGQFGCIAAKPG